MGMFPHPEKTTHINTATDDEQIDRDPHSQSEPENDANNDYTDNDLQQSYLSNEPNYSAHEHGGGIKNDPRAKRKVNDYGQQKSPGIEPQQCSKKPVATRFV